MYDKDNNLGLFWAPALRNVGLGAWNSLLSRYKGRNEEKKIVITKSWRLAIARCTVHLLPVLVSVAIIAINAKGIYIGIDFHSRIPSESINVAMLQVAAKLQELAIIASLATVTFQLLRHELVHGDGLPLGLLVAGFQFSKISYFFSSEMLGSLKHAIHSPHKLRKFALILFLVIVGILAVAVGPSCAVLLVPQMQNWPAGRAQAFLNGTFDQLWPAYLSANESPLQPLCSSPDAVNHGVCPSGGFHSLWAHHVGLQSENFRSVVPAYSKKLSGNNYFYSTRSPQPLLTRTITLGIWNYPTSFIQPHLGVAAVLDNLMQKWWSQLKQGPGFDEKNVDDRAATSQAHSAMSTIRCGTPKLASIADQQILFPTSQGRTSFNEQNLTALHVKISPSAHLQFSWVSLPHQDFTSVGAVYQSPWTSDNKSRIVVGCTIQANWVPTQIHMDAYSFWQGFYPKNVTFEDMYPKSGSPLFNDTSGHNTLNAVVVDSSWLAMLTPPTPLSGPGFQSWGPSTIESILEGTMIAYNDSSTKTLASIESWQDVSGNRTNLLTSVVGSVFNDGFARAGLERIFNAAGEPIFYEKAQSSTKNLLKEESALHLPGFSKEFSSELIVQFQISGHSYRMTIASTLATAALCIHILIATTHTIWTLHKRQSSECWDSVTEILVLAQNSRPAYSALKNTAAGINKHRTYAKNVTIRPTRLPNKEEVDHLEMIYDEETCIQDVEDVDGPTEMQHWRHRAAEYPHFEDHLDASSSTQENGQVARPLHASTWPSTQKRHSRAPSRWSEPSSVDQVSLSDSPLLTGPGLHGQSVELPGRARIKINEKYG